MKTDFKTIGLVVRKDVQSHLETIRQVTGILETRAQVLIHCLDLEKALPGIHSIPIKDLVSRADLVISLGGDGTLLTAARALAGSSCPLVGINLGRLGFLADLSIRDVEKHLVDILDGNHRLEKRFFIKGRFFSDNRLVHDNIALNDIIVHSHKTLSMIEYQVYSDGDLIHRQRADGVIVATPTGSTAYALSGGGPIMHPVLNTLAIVPICPHTLSNRPIVVPANQKIEIRLTRDDNLALVHYDGHAGREMNSEHRIEISKYPRPLRLLHPRDYDYFEILRAKLYWSTNH